MSNTPPSSTPVMRLIALGVAIFVAVVGYQLGPKLWKQWRVQEPADKVVSAASSDFAVPMAVSPAQTGKLEPPGVAKPLKLFAVTLGTAPGQGRAALGPAEASARTYVTGAKLENGAVLTEVLQDHVTLTRDGRVYSLYLPNKGASDQVESYASLTVGDYGPVAPPLPQAVVRATDAIRLVPAYNGTAIAGFTAYPGTRSAEFTRWGLKSGDVITNLGGVYLSSPDQVEPLLDQLAGGASLVADVQRGEERLQVTLDGAALAAASQAPGVSSMGPPPL